MEAVMGEFLGMLRAGSGWLIIARRNPFDK
jgi:hypothetical protein